MIWNQESGRVVASMKTGFSVTFAMTFPPTLVCWPGTLSYCTVRKSFQNCLKGDLLYALGSRSFLSLGVYLASDAYPHGANRYRFATRLQRLVHYVQ